MDAILNQGMPAPLDIQVSGMDMEADASNRRRDCAAGTRLAGGERRAGAAGRGLSVVEIDIDRERASELGLSAKEVVDSLITALTSDGMIAPSYWIDPKTGNDYLLTVQYPENFVKNLADLASMPLRRCKLKADHTAGFREPDLAHPSPTEVDHYQLQRVTDVYVAPAGEDLSRVLGGRAEDHSRTETAGRT